ncbi:hypothetical protein F5X96DRAFT_545173 [Biscogniauxia mediterranea]|nr:hypothetical protein F5X96DRAFT_545173 [Biscogniauxia mediterranea]
MKIMWVEIVKLQSAIEMWVMMMRRIRMLVCSSAAAAAVVMVESGDSGGGDGGGDDDDGGVLVINRLNSAHPLQRHPSKKKNSGDGRMGRAFLQLVPEGYVMRIELACSWFYICKSGGCDKG